MIRTPGDGCVVKTGLTSRRNSLLTKAALPRSRRRALLCCTEKLSFHIPEINRASTTIEVNLIDELNAQIGGGESATRVSDKSAHWRPAASRFIRRVVLRMAICPQYPESG